MRSALSPPASPLPPNVGRSEHRFGRGSPDSRLTEESGHVEMLTPVLDPPVFDLEHSTDRQRRRLSLDGQHLAVEHHLGVEVESGDVRCYARPALGGDSVRTSRIGKSFRFSVTTTAPCARAVPAINASGVRIATPLAASSR